MNLNNVAMWLVIAILTIVLAFVSITFLGFVISANGG